MARQHHGLRASLSGFELTVTRNLPFHEWTVDIGTGPGDRVSAFVSLDGFEAAAVRADEDGDWGALVDILRRSSVGTSRFRKALGFLAASDSVGWQASCAAPATAA